ncbi:MAG: hypothetical protein AAFX93_03340 [Verrucomicrobiota bacterium]
MNLRSSILTLLATSLVSLSTQTLNANLTPVSGYQSGQVLSSQTLGAFDIYSDGGTRAYGWDSNTSTLRRYDVSGGGVLGDFGAPTGGYADSAFISFVRRSPDGNSVWVGFTVGGNTDDRIYEVTDLSGTPTWNLRTTLGGNFDMEFSGNDAFVSANPGGFGNPNRLFYLDAANSYTAIQFATTGGFSADLAFDATGALVYGTSGLASEQLVSFAAGDISAFLSNPGSWTPFNLGDGTLLSSLPSGASSLWADSVGGIFVALSDFSAFPFSGTLAQWNGTTSAGTNLDTLATADDSLGELDGLGVLALDGTLYQSVGFGNSGIDTLEIPEPSTYALIVGVAILGLRIASRRK